MRSRTNGKIALGLLLLACVWIAVYWSWPVDAPIRFERSAQPTSPDAGAREHQSSVPPPPQLREPAQPLAQSDTPALPTAGVIAPTFFEDTVRAGDTFESIAKRHLGDANKADVIARANPLMSPINLREGRIVRIPRDPANLQGVPVPRGENGELKPLDTASPALPTQDYVVQRGDSLARIAKRLLGDERHATLIFEANRDKLDDPAKIRVGQRLTIPPAPAQASADGDNR